ncbi:MAG TPA: PilZ domain-containing protein [Polyangia bacterium]
MDYREPVRVIWPGEVSGVVARAVNLSSAGILVDAPTPTPCPVGSDVLCDVILPRGPRLLRGRVAHRRLLSAAKVGMGIEFVDLSPHEVAELRDVIDESDEKPQRVKVRFEGTNQVVRASAFPTDEGFRLSTSLPFLKPDTEVDIALSPDASVSTRGWVSRVALERSQVDGAPRLLIDVRIDDAELTSHGSSALTPVVETLTSDRTPFEDPIEVGAMTPTIVSADTSPLPAADDSEPPLVDGLGATPAVADSDRTEIVRLERPSRWRALGGGMIAGLIALAAFVAAIVLMKTVRSSAPLPPSISSAPIVMEKVAPPAEPVPENAAPAEPVVGVAPTPERGATRVSAVVAPAEPEPDAKPETYSVALAGSLAGSRRYLLRDPDGIAFNLPHARAKVAFGIYRPRVPGLRSVWVHALPGGGINLRFFLTPQSPDPAPLIELARDGVRVTAR